MRYRTVRLFTTAATLLAFFVLWTVIAAKPWATVRRPTPDPRLLALAVREHRLRVEAAAVSRLVARRWQTYDRRLGARRRAIAAVEQRHALRLAAARLAAERIVAAQTAAQIAAQAVASQATYAAAPATPSSGGVPSPAPAPRVVTLPPRVQIVSLPPVTSSSSSHP